MVQVAQSTFFANERGFKRIADLMNEFVWIGDGEGNILWLNGAWKSVTGFSGKKISIDEWPSLAHRIQNFEDTLKSYKRNIQSKKTWELTWSYADNNGELRWLLAVGVPVYDKNGNLFRWLGHHTDITEQKKNEKELGLSKRRYELATLATMDLVWDLNITTKRWTWSPAINKVFGYDLGDLETSIEWFFDHIHPDDRARIRTSVNKAFEKKLISYQEKYRFQKANGEYAHIFDRGYLLYSNKGEPLRMIGAMADVTWQRNAMENLKNAKKAAEIANEAKSAFLANVSHEVRTPLSAILGYAEIIKEMVGDQQELVEHLGIIERNGNQVLRIIDDVLDLAKVESGTLEIQKACFKTKHLIEDVKALLKDKKAKDVRFRVETDPDLPEELSSDVTRLRQIITNLAGNALKFTEQGEVALRLEHRRPYLVMTIRDTGPGIKKSIQGKVFEPFNQGDSSISRKFGGTGLGLALTKKLANSMGGDTYLKWSEPDIGSEFEAVVKVDDASQVKEGPRKRNASDWPLKDKHILVIDDSQDIRILVKNLLGRKGAIVSCANGAKEGIKKAVENTYDLILLDIQMPEMDGYRALQKIRAKGVKTPIAALTAHAMKEERDKAYLAGFSGFITKPMKVDSVVSMVNSFH